MDYLLDRSERDWMADLMVACAEVQRSVGVSRSGGCLPAGPERQGAAAASDPAVAGAPMEPAASDPAVAGAAKVPLVAVGAAEAGRGDDVIHALEWATGCKDLGFLVSSAGNLPERNIAEQLRMFRAAPSEEWAGTLAIVARNGG